MSANAAAFAEELRPVVEAIGSKGHVSLRATAAELNRRGIGTRRGGTWGVSNVQNMLSTILQAIALKRKAGEVIEVLST